MEKAAGEVLGPRPGRAICSFWQGNVEIAGRIIAPLVGSFPALVTAAVTLGLLQSGTSSNQSVVTSRASAGLVVGITSLAILLEVLFIILRVCNIGLINIKIKVFLIIVVAVEVFLVLGHLVGGIITAVFTPRVYPLSIGHTMAISASFCLVSVFLYGFVVAWGIIFMLKEWNDKVIKYTLKEAVLG